jgi:hypothetical protein
MKTPADTKKAQPAGQYFTIILLAPLVLLTCWIGFKLGLEHRLAGRNASGYPGLMSGPAPELLFLGSSHTRQSYDVAAIEAATGRSTYLLSYGALDLNFMDLLLRDILPDPAHRPKCIVLEAYSAKLARGPDIGDDRLFFDVPPGLKLKVISNYLQFHPGFSSWLDIFDLVVNRGTERIVTYPVNSRILADLSYKGGYRGHTMPGLTQSAFQSLHADIVSSNPDPAQLTALLDIIRLCKQYGVQLLLAESPMPKPTSSKPEILNLKRVFREEAVANGLPYLNGDESFPTGDPALFLDAGHLSTAGRALYTSKMLEQFGPLFAEGRQLANQYPAASIHQDTPRGVSLYRR